MPDLHHDAVVVDCHNDLILLVDRKRSIGEGTHFRNQVIPALRAGGVDVQIVPVFIEREYAAEAALGRTPQLIEELHREVAANGDEVVLSLTGAEIDKAVARGKIALVLALEGCEAIGQQPELFGALYRNLPSTGAVIT